MHALEIKNILCLFLIQYIFNKLLRFLSVSQPPAKCKDKHQVTSHCHMLRIGNYNILDASSYCQPLGQDLLRFEEINQRKQDDKPTLMIVKFWTIFPIFDIFYKNKL